MWKPDPSVIITAEAKAAAARDALLAQFSSAIQSHLDTKARERDYDDMWSAITYRDDPNPQFAAEGQALFEWRSDVWTYATTELARVTAGEREIPTVEEFLVELPVFTWPDVQPASQPE